MDVVDIIGDDDEPDEHFCLKCKTTIQGLEKYVKHRKRKCQDQGEPSSRAEPGHAGQFTISTEPAVPAATSSDQSKGQAGSSHVTAGQENDGQKTQFDFNQEHLEATDFFQSLHLQYTKQSEEEMIKELPKEKLDDMTFFESIGLYWVNPADKPEDDHQDHVASSSKMKLWDHNRDVEKGKETNAVTDFAQEVDELDFLHVLGLTPVAGGGMGSGIGKKWRLWNPEDDTPGWAEEMLCSDVYLPESAANDPTLMEDQVHGLIEKTAEEVPVSEYYCEQCHRSLSTEDLYSKHLMSELHFKNSGMHDLDVERPKRITKKPKFFDDVPEITSTTAAPEHNPVEGVKYQDIGNQPGEIEVSSKLMECSSCKAKVLPHQYGKHLVSHYHYHRSLGQPDNQEVILEHIGKIVRQSPFQCEPCSFFCNWHEDFISHIKGHDVTDQTGTFWCQVCMKIIHSHKLLVQHLKSFNHTELVSVINRSVPVIIKQIDLIKCNECDNTFRFNLGLKKHMRSAHNQPDFELEDQPKYFCDYCTYFCFKTSSLKAHQFLVHSNSKLKYDCFICKKQFANKETSLAHRNSLSHKMNSINKEENIECRECNFCSEQFFDLDELKEHLEISHTQELPQCHLCGGLFHFHQEVSVHIRRKCKPKSRILLTGGTYKCIHCPFSTNNASLLTLHDMYKHQPLENDTSITKKCPVCGVVVDTKRLKTHLQTHNSSNYKCGICSKIFVLETTLKDHMNLFHGNESSSKVHHCFKCTYQTPKKILLNLHIKRQHSQSEIPEHNEVCTECGAKFKLKTSLNNHMKTHNSMLPYDLICRIRGCDFKCNFKSDLDRHNTKHSIEKNIKCEVCDCNYKCKRKSELVRHQKLVHEHLPFSQCEHCEYKTKNNCHMKRHMKTHQMHEVAYYEVHLDENDFMLGKHEFATPPEFVTEQVIEN
eukprot:GFUD01025648.1.p1 GENE.GFUD01025648.1~~GFUD01025648.1.p1  ORF type:complete len:932 (-),score=207.05 GFUD01025648.1:76-2871(-)